MTSVSSGEKLLLCHLHKHTVTWRSWPLFVLYASLLALKHIWQPIFTCSVTAMSSYLYIVKSELPLVIQAFLKADPNSEWVLSPKCFSTSTSQCCWCDARDSRLLSSSDTVCQVKGPGRLCGQWIYFSLHHSLIQSVWGVMRMAACNWLNGRGPMVGYYLSVMSTHNINS